MDIEQVRADLDAIKKDASLEDALNLAGRVAALAQLEFADEFVRLRAPPAERAVLARRVDVQRARLEQVNERLYDRARARFRAAGMATRPTKIERRELRAWLDPFTNYRPQQTHPIHTGYDALDALIDGVLNLNESPRPRKGPRAK